MSCHFCMSLWGIRVCLNHHELLLYIESSCFHFGGNKIELLCCFWFMRQQFDKDNNNNNNALCFLCLVALQTLEQTLCALLFVKSFVPFFTWAYEIQLLFFVCVCWLVCLFVCVQRLLFCVCVCVICSLACILNACVYNFSTFNCRWRETINLNTSSSTTPH